jgi:hypothetical protein
MLSVSLNVEAHSAPATFNCQQVFPYASVVCWFAFAAAVVGKRILI